MKRLFTFLGTTSYSEAVYALEGVEAKATPYIQQALLDILNREEQEIGEIVVFLTKEAREENWTGGENLKKRLQQVNVEITEVDINAASTKEEVWSFYETITNNVKKGDEIAFDITHSLRYQPMIAMLVMHFARTIKDAKIDGVYYGSFDKDQRENPDYSHEIIDLSMIADMQDWITHAYVFSETGRADLMTEWLSFEQRLIRQKERAEADDLKPLEQVTRRWMELDQVIRTNLSLDRKKAADNLLREIDKVDEQEVRPVFKPVLEVLKKSAADFKKLAADDQLNGDLNTVSWNIELGNIQPALTIMKEITLSTIMKKAGLEIINKKDRDVAGGILHYATKYSVGRQIEADAHKAWQNVDKDQILNEKSSWDIDAYEQVFIQLHGRPKLLKTERDLSEIRNIVNHAGFRESTPKASKIIDNTKRGFEDYKQYITHFWNDTPE